MRITLIVAALLCPGWGAAASLHLSYDGTLAGLPVIKAEIVLDQDAAGYSMRTTVHTIGAFARLVAGQSDIISQGRWRGAAADPTHVDSEGYWNGRPRRLIIDYDEGRPVVRLMVPTDAGRQRALDRADTDGTTDMLGLAVSLVHEVATSATCAQRSRVFDGRGVTEFAITPDPGGVVDRLQCSFTTRKVVGRDTGDDTRRVGHGFVLFARAAPGVGWLPIRIVFHTRWSGDAALVLTNVSAAHVPQ